MYDTREICEKIKSVFPDIGECGIDVKVRYDKKNEALVVHLKKGEHQLDTFLEPEDAKLCMEGKQCISLGVKIGQLRANIERA